MNQKRNFSWIFAPIAMAILILDTKTAYFAAIDGINMCMRSVVPSLFPFIVISSLTTKALLGRFRKLLRPLGKLCRIPEGCESLLLTGFLGGYPVGAQCIYQAYCAGSISRKDAERMIGFCNNAGPSFIFGIVGSLFSNSWIPWILWGVHILSALIVGIILPGSAADPCRTLNSQKTTLVKSISGSIKTMANICGFVLLFRVIISYADKYILLLLPQYLSITITGLLELTNGCLALQNIAGEHVRFLICTALLSFGGICITLQTAAVTEGLDTRFYFPGKVMQCCISVLFAELLVPLVFNNAKFYVSLLIIPVCVLIFVSYFQNCTDSKKSIAFSQNMIYNGKKSNIRGNYHAL